MKIKRSSFPLFFLKQTDQEGVLDQMIKGGFVHQTASGVYSWLHLGLRLIEKITATIDEELQAINAVKMLMPVCQNASFWKESERYNSVGKEMLTMQDRNKREFVFGPSSEEMFTHLLTKYSLNSKSYPIILYNNQWKFRDELRPRYGVVRSREFLMNDAYSFHLTIDDLMKTYRVFFEAYSRIFASLQLNVYTFSSDVGYMGGFLSHEFVTESIQGETRVSCETLPRQPISWNERDYFKENSISGETFCELAHIYALGDKYAKTFKLKSPIDNKYVYMGCYGIGITRIAGIMFEKKINFGKFAPYENVLITHGTNDSEIANKIYNKFSEICWDDRDESIGVKFNEADLMKASKQICVGKKEIENKKILVKECQNQMFLTYEEFFNKY